MQPSAARLIPVAANPPLAAADISARREDTAAANPAHRERT
jgi:hypothetical protein